MQGSCTSVCVQRGHCNYRMQQLAFACFVFALTLRRPLLACPQACASVHAHLIPRLPEQRTAPAAVPHRAYSPHAPPPRRLPAAPQGLGDSGLARRPAARASSRGLGQGGGCSECRGGSSRAGARGGAGRGWGCQPHYAGVPGVPGGAAGDADVGFAGEEGGMCRKAGHWDQGFWSA